MHSSTPIVPIVTKNLAAVTRCQPLRTSFKWKIQHIFRSKLEVNRPFFESPSFLFVGARWTLIVFPDRNSSIYVNLTKVYSENPIHEIGYKISLKDCKGNYHYAFERTFAFENNGATGPGGMEIRHKELLEKQEELMPDNNMIVFCDLWANKEPRSSAVIELPDKKLHLNTQSAETNFRTLSNDLKFAYFDRRFCDMKLMVRDREFSVHKIMLAARSTVFAAMFKQNMKEAITGTVHIEDIDADVVEELLKYIYTGEVRKLPLDNLLKLYAAAEKYSLQELKESCVIYVIHSLSSSNFFSIADVAYLYEDKILKNSVQSVFRQNIESITKREEWNIFKTEKPNIASELISAIALEN